MNRPRSTELATIAVLMLLGALVGIGIATAAGVLSGSPVAVAVAVLGGLLLLAAWGVRRA
jgi:hypothetical protein